MVKFESFRQVRYQDVGVVIALIIAVFLLRAPDVFQLKPVWRLDIKEHHENHFLPLPLISDLDNDGISEMVVVTSKSILKVMTFPSHDPSAHSVLPHLHTKHEVSLKDDANFSHHEAANPVAIATGCLRTTLESGTCYQSIVVVTSDWSVRLYDHYLNLLWKTNVGQHKKPVFFREIAALISPHHEDGLVLIGGRAGTKPYDKHTFSHRHASSNNISTETVEELSRGGFVRQSLNTRKIFNEDDHFSSFAFNGANGRLVWSHKPGDFEVKRSSREVLLSSYHFKLALHPNQHHVGEEHWSRYRTSLLRNLPHRWHHASDTTLSTSYFVKSATKSSHGKDEGSWFDIRTPNIDIFNSDQEKAVPKNKPNAIVIHNKRGLEVLHLQTGRPLCHYTVNKDGVSLGDVNNDEVIDHVTTRFMSPDETSTNHLSCAAVVTSESRMLFERPICQTLSFFGGMFDREVSLKKEILPVPPVVVYSPPHRSGILRHLMGHNLRRGRVGLDSIFLVSTGKVTSFGPHGELNWQVKIDGEWNRRPEFKQNDDKVKYFPSMKTVPIEVEQEKKALLITSWLHMSLVAITDGTVLASHLLPCQPMSPVVHGDFTNDGLTDFVVHCSDSYLGFSLERSINYMWTAIWLVSGLVVLGVALLTMRLFEELIIE